MRLKRETSERHTLSILVDNEAGFCPLAACSRRAATNRKPTVSDVTQDEAIIRSSPSSRPALRPT